MEYDKLEIGRSYTGSMCLICHGDFNVKTIFIGYRRDMRLSIDLCKACRVLLHKRLHQEDDLNA